MILAVHGSTFGNILLGPHKKLKPLIVGPFNPKNFAGRVLGGKLAAWPPLRRPLLSDKIMPIRGLSNQWKSCEGLLERFAPAGAQRKWGMIRQLLESLNAQTGPTIYIGTSHSLMNFSNRDVIHGDVRNQPFAYVDVVRSRQNADDFCYRVKTRKVNGTRPTSTWLQQDFTDTEPVVDLLIDAFAYADIPSAKQVKRKPPFGGLER